MPIDPLTLIMLAVLALLVFFMFRNGRKRQKDLADLQAKMVAGTDVMTNFGLYGTIVHVDEAENKVALEVAPGTVVNIHRQTIARVVEPVAPEAADDATTAPAGDAALGEGSEFGQRFGDTSENQPKKGDE